MVLNRIVISGLLGVLILCPVAVLSDTVAVPLTEKPPVVDGKLTDACWQKAASLEGFRILGTTKEPEVGTKCLIMRDQQWLYVGFLCEERGRAVLAEQSGHNGSAGSDDSVEIFISPQHGSSSYYQFVLGAGRSWYEQAVHGRRKDRGWQVPWKKATSVQKDGWTAEVAIPLYILGQDIIGKAPVGFNVARNRRLQPSQYLTWGPLGAGFHEPQNFGALTGLEGQPLTAVLAPSIVEAVALNYGVKEGQFIYATRVKLSNLGGKSGQAKLSFEDSPEVGKKNTITREVSIVPLGTQEVVWEIPIETFSERSARVSILGQEVEEWASVKGLDGLSPIKVFMDRNYYTTEKQAEVICVAVFSKEDASRQGLSVALTVADSRGNSLFQATKKTIGQRSSFSLPVGRIKPGSYQVKAMLKSRQGQKLAAAETILAKYPPAPSTEVKFDQINEVMLVDGKPFFPFGFMSLSFDEETCKELADGGFNAMVNWSGVIGGRSFDFLPEEKAKLDIAQKYGIKVFEAGLSFGPRVRYGDEDLAEKLEETVNNLPTPLAMWREHPAVIGYYGLDEPSPTYYEYARGMYEVIHENDPYRLMYSSNCGDWKPEGYEIFDLLGRHGYWDPGVFDLGDPNKLARRCTMMRELAQRFHRPFVATPQGYDFRAWRPLIPKETRVSYYLPLIQGAKGLIIFTYRAGRHAAWWKAATEIAAEINQLAPILLPPSPPQNIECNVTAEPQKPVLPPGPAAILTDFQPMTDAFNKVVLPQVQALIKNHPKGGEVILVANGEDEPADVTFTLSSIGKNTKVKGFFDGKELSVKGATFSDQLEGYGVRVYRTFDSNRRSPDEPVRLAINVVGEKEERQALPNILKTINGDFESGQIGKFWPPSKGAKVEVLADKPHSGKYCVSITADEKGTASLTTGGFPLKAKTRYRFGAWVRSKIAAGKSNPKLMILVPYKFQTPPRMSMDIPLIQEEWKEIAHTFTTKEAAEVSISLTVYPGKGTVYVDDIFLEELGEAEERGNLLLNSSFEEATYFSVPDCWGISSWSTDNEKPFSIYERQIEGDAIHGKYAVRVGWWRNTPPRGHYRHISTFQGFCLNFARDYVFSIYLKADRENAPITMTLETDWRVRPPINLSKSFTVGTEWARYVFPMPLSKEKRLGTYKCRVAVRLDKICLIYADAAQLEVGLTPTEYAPDDYKAVDLGEKYSRKSVMNQP